MFFPDTVKRQAFFIWKNLLLVFDKAEAASVHAYRAHLTKPDKINNGTKNSKAGVERRFVWFLANFYSSDVV
jgi:hypothetical protein